MQNQTIFELYVDHNKSKYSSNPYNFLKCGTEFLSKISNRKKISNEHFNICKAEIFLDEIIKSIDPFHF